MGVNLLHPASPLALTILAGNGKGFASARTRSDTLERAVEGAAADGEGDFLEAIGAFGGGIIPVPAPAPIKLLMGLF